MMISQSLSLRPCHSELKSCPLITCQKLYLLLTTIFEAVCIVHPRALITIHSFILLDIDKQTDAPLNKLVHDSSVGILRYHLYLCHELHLSASNVGTNGESLRQRMYVHLHLPTKHQS